MKAKRNDARRGQAMLLATLALGGAILGATTIAGLLMLYQIRATTDSEHSAQAIFAADSGVEWTLYDFYCDATSTLNPASRCDPSQREQQSVMPGTPSSTPGNSTLGNGAFLEVLCYTSSTIQTTCSSTSTPAASAISKGTSLNSKRAFYLDITGATAILP
jgi:hypothetical protein